MGKLTISTGQFSIVTIWLCVTVCHDKSPCLLGKPSRNGKRLHYELENGPVEIL